MKKYLLMIIILIGLYTNCSTEDAEPIIDTPIVVDDKPIDIRTTYEPYLIPDDRYQSIFRYKGDPNNISKFDIWTKHLGDYKYQVIIQGGDNTTFFYSPLKGTATAEGTILHFDLDNGKEKIVVDGFYELDPLYKCKGEKTVHIVCTIKGWNGIAQDIQPCVQDPNYKDKNF